jgi:hypothetical protein
MDRFILPLVEALRGAGCEASFEQPNSLVVAGCRFYIHGRRNAVWFLGRRFAIARKGDFDQQGALRLLFEELPFRLQQKSRQERAERFLAELKFLVQKEVASLSWCSITSMLAIRATNDGFELKLSTDDIVRCMAAIDTLQDTGLAL